MTACCELVRVRHSLGAVLSCAAWPGELLAVIGPNGAGQARLLGRPTDQWPNRDRARLLAYVPQSAEAPVPYRVDELVRLGRAPWQGMLGIGSAEDAKITSEALALAGLAHLADRPVERQRASIAKALCQTPRVLLLDEPTTGLDYARSRS